MVLLPLSRDFDNMDELFVLKKTCYDKINCSNHKTLRKKEYEFKRIKSKDMVIFSEFEYVLRPHAKLIVSNY